jgi:hypothetical protein
MFGAWYSRGFSAIISLVDSYRSGQSFFEPKSDDGGGDEPGPAGRLGTANDADWLE